MLGLRRAIAPLFAALLIGCDETAPSALGDLRIIATTSGGDADTDGYSLVVGEEEIGALGPDGEAIVSGLSAGEYGVALSGLASNCDAADNPRVATVVGGEITTETFAVACEDRVGDLRVTTTTSGSSIDPDGYFVSVGDAEPVIVPSSGSVLIPALPEGTITVMLGGQADNCTPAQTNIPATIGHRTTVEIGFAIVCTPAGTLRTSVATTGPDAPANGYRISIGPAGTVYHTSRPLAASDVVEWTRPAGDWTVMLEGPTPNCRVDPAQYLTVNLPNDAVVEVAFRVTCDAAGRIAFTGQAAGEEQSDIFTIATNGAGLRRLTTSSAEDLHPDWSPNGAKLAFTSSRDGGLPAIWVMNSDGSGATRLFGNGPAMDPAWSPDGSRIAFTRQDGETSDVYVMNADGRTVVRLTSDPAPESEPAWSPDGTRIAFLRAHQNGSTQLYVMNADGSATVRLTDEHSTAARWSPAWSPDGSLIAVASNASSIFDSGGIWLVPTDGRAEPYPLLLGHVVRELSWSPDGAWIAYANGTSVWSMRVAPTAGGGVYAGVATGVDWRP